ncbi:MAG: hypothetical protein ABI822_29400, partial [Bryobacteraceae bacterium]
MSRPIAGLLGSGDRFEEHSALNIFMVSGNPAADEKIRRDFSQCSLRIAGGVNRYPASEELRTLLDRAEADIVFLDSTGFQDVLRICAAVEASHPGVPIVVIGVPEDGNKLLHLLRAGVREVLAFPVVKEDLSAAVANVARFIS